MPLFRDPVITLIDVRIRTLSLTSLDLVVEIRVQNPNLLGITLRELPFSILWSSGGSDREIAAGNAGRVKIPARGSTVLHIPVTSQNTALLGGRLQHSSPEAACRSPSVVRRRLNASFSAGRSRSQRPCR